MKKKLLLLFCIVSVGVVVGQNDRILVTDLTKIKQISGITASPDGKKAVFAITSIESDPDTKEEYKYMSQIYLTDFQATPTALTRGIESSRQPVWSPDGTKLAFVRTVKTKPQLFVLSLNGGEAYQLTQSPYPVSHPKWSPDGKKILFTVTLSLPELLKDSLFNEAKEPPVWSLEKPGFPQNEHIQLKSKVKPNPNGTLEEIRAYLNKDIEDKKAKVINRLQFQGESTTEPDITFTHLATIEVRENAKMEAITQDFYSFTEAIWTPDSRKIICVTNFQEQEANGSFHPDRHEGNRIFSMNADGSDLRPLLSERGKAFASPVVSPDGKLLAFQKITASIMFFDQATIYLAPLNHPEQQTAIPIDRNTTRLTFSPDSRFLYFTAPSNGGFPLYRHDVKTHKTDMLSDYSSSILDFDVTASSLVYVKTEVTNPAELYVADKMLQHPRLLTNLHASWLQKKKLSIPEKYTFTNEKGQTVEYWIMKPTFAEAGKKYPLMLQMHGGPAAMWGPGEFSMWHEFQFFCAKGYSIVYANPRGSAGYGVDFQKANYQDWGTGPASDVLRAATEAAKANWVDTSRQVLTGGSYAGYLTAWIVGHDHRFKAAFAQRGVYDLTTFMGEGNAWQLVPRYFGGYPWQPEIRQVLDSNSPLSFVTSIHTPLLIKHGENDLRTGVIQSEMLYKSLKLLGRDVEYVRMPGGTHELSRSGNVRQRLDRLLRIYEFMERYIGK